jgi:hypothetical protein
MLSTVDGVSYLSIARQYAQGHLDAAVNAYWSPLASWLIAPLLVAGVPEILAFGLINAAAIAIGAALIGRLVWRRAGRRMWLTVAVIVVFFVFAIGNLPVLTPDMMVVVWMLLLVSVLIEADDRLPGASRRQRVVLGVILGAVGVLGYVTKLYLVPVFVVVLLGWALVRIGMAGRAGRRRMLRRAGAFGAVVALTAAVLAAPWVATMSAKYGEFMAGSSFGVNLEEKFEPGDAQEPAAPAVLWAPPNEYAVSFGEDRTAQVASADPSTASGSPSPGAVERIRYYISQRFAALPFYLTKIGSIAPFAVLTVAVVLFLLVFGPRSGPRRDLALIGLTWGVYFLGYAAITTAATRGGNSRYYWPMLVLALVLAAILVPEIWRRFASGRGRLRSIAIVAVLALIPAGVLWQHGVGKGAPFSTEAPLAGLGYLLRPAAPWAEQTFAAESLAPVIPEGSRLVGSNYRMTLRYAYYLHAQVYGRADQGYVLADAGFQRLMADAGIDFYLRFTPVGSEPVDLGEAGTIVATFTGRSTCSDDKVAAVEDCTIDVVRLR